MTRSAPVQIEARARTAAGAERVPPFASLRALEAAARHRSYSAAARELQVTHSAVSQAIRRLEQELATRLFQRRGGFMEPTPAALELARVYSEAEGSLIRTLDTVSKANPQPSLVIAMAPDFGRLWFAPRLESISTALPDLSLEVRSLRRGGAPPEDAQVLVQVGPPEAEGWAAEPALELGMLATCSPAYAVAQHIETPRDVFRVHALSERLLPWDVWLRAKGMNSRAALHGHVFDDAGMMLDATARGHGLALTYALLAEDHLRSGTLIAPLGGATPTGERLYVGWRSPPGRTAAVERFIGWFASEIRRPAAGDEGEA